MLCRLCIFECTDEGRFDIFKKELNLLKLIEKYLHLEIAHKDISTVICSNCLQHLKDFDDFFAYIKQRQEVFEAACFKNDFVDMKKTNESSSKAEGARPDIADNDEDDKTCEIPETIEFNPTFPTKASKDFKKADDVALLVPSELQTKAQKSNIANQAPKAQQSSGVNENSSNGNSGYTIVKSHSELEDEKDKFIEEHVHLKCKICRTISDTFKNFQRHFLEKHNCPAYIKCCGSRHYTRQQIVKHLQSHLNPDLFKCQICNKTLSSKANLESHIASFHTDREKLPHICEVCGDRFTTPYILRSHMIVHEEGNNFKCEICNKTFKHLRSIKRHKKLQHGNYQNHVCELCGKNYKYKQIFEQHMAEEHNIISKDTMIYCMECRRWFSTKFYQKHAERHQIKDVECKYCGKICPSKVALDKHLDSHYHKKKCQICGSSFNLAKDLREHMKTHAKE